MAHTPGTRLRPYEIVSAIGAGGMEEVYRARGAAISAGQIGSQAQSQVQQIYVVLNWFQELTSKVPTDER